MNFANQKFLITVKKNDTEVTYIYLHEGRVFYSGDMLYWSDTFSYNKKMSLNGSVFKALKLDISDIRKKYTDFL